MGMSAAELQHYYRSASRRAGSASGDLGERTTIEELGNRSVRLRVEFDDRAARPGGSVAGPMLFALVDSAGWIMAVAHHGAGVDAFTTDVSMQFLRPVATGVVVAQAEVLRRGRRDIIEVDIEPSPDGPAVHAVVGFVTRAAEGSSGSA